MFTAKMAVFYTDRCVVQNFYRDRIWEVFLCFVVPQLQSVKSAQQKTKNPSLLSSEKIQHVLIWKVRVYILLLHFIS